MQRRPPLGGCTERIETPTTLNVNLRCLGLPVFVVVVFVFFIVDMMIIIGLLMLVVQLM
jgi:maltodextrin utilization protein YvdJ